MKNNGLIWYFLRLTDGRKLCYDNFKLVRPRVESGNKEGNMTYADFFYEIKNRFMGTDVSDIQEHLAFQFSIEDEEAGGAFYVEVKDGQLLVEPYEFYDRDANFIANPDTFMKIAEGKLDPVFAFTTQKLKVEGNIEKALKLKEIIDLKQKQAKKKK